MNAMNKPCADNATRHGTNAFSVLMKAARAPLAFDLLAPGSKHEDSLPHQLRIEEACNLYPRVLLDHMERVSDRVQELGDDLANVPPMKVDHTINGDAGSIPAAPDQPLPGISIKRVTAYFRFADEEDINDHHLHIVGFVLKKSNKEEIEIGGIRGSTRHASFHVADDEFIEKVAQMGCEEDGGIEAVYFRTTRERQFWFRQGDVSSEDYYGGAFVKRHDKVVSSLILHAQQRILANYAYVGQDAEFAFEKLPSLQVLAKRSIPDGGTKELKQLQGRFMCTIRGMTDKIDRAARGKLLDAFLENSSRIDALQELDQLSCNELDMYSKARCVLWIRNDSELASLQRMSDRIVREVERQFAFYKETLASEYCADRNLLWEHCTAEHEKLLLHTLAPDGSKICRDCFRNFVPSRVRHSLRCQVAGCFDSAPSCGCATTSCQKCFTVTCISHRDSHEKWCSTTFKSRCGWQNGSRGLNIKLCGEVDADLRKCADCKSMCCAQCRVNCTGKKRLHNCHEIWSGHMDRGGLDGGIHDNWPSRHSDSCQIALCKSCFGNLKRVWMCYECHDGVETWDEEETDSDYMSEASSTSSLDSLGEMSLESVSTEVVDGVVSLLCKERLQRK